MLIYLIDVVGDLCVTAILAGLVFAYARSAHGNFGMKVACVGVLVIAVLSAVMAYFKTFTSLVASRDWNLGIFTAMLVIVLVVGVCAIIGMVTRKRKAAAGGEGRESGPLDYVVLFGLVALLMLRIFYKLPNVLGYPTVIVSAADNFVSSDFVLRAFAYLLGIAVAAATAVAIYKALRTLSMKYIGGSLAIVLAIVTFAQVMTGCQILMTKRVIMPKTDLYAVLFPLTAWVNNNIILLTLVIDVIIIALAGIVIFLSLQDKDPYRNPAEHRKNRALWRNRRRWSIFIIVCLAFSVVTLTVVKDYATAGPQLSESEECEVRDGYLYVPLDQVDDEHLHRFTYETQEGYVCKNSKYTTQGGVGVRFIVVKKPNSSAYGVGLDACEICGQTGYYEREGQVVCKLCDVVMNKNTIGFKGGCNPIPFDYEVKDGYIVVNCDVLAEYEKTFK